MRTTQKFSPEDEAIYRTVNGFKDKIATEKRESAERIVAFEKAIAAVQSACPHRHTEYHPDASGNNDSYTECVVCDYWKGRGS